MIHNSQIVFYNSFCSLRILKKLSVLYLRALFRICNIHVMFQSLCLYLRDLLILFVLILSSYCKILFRIPSSYFRILFRFWNPQIIHQDCVVQTSRFTFPKDCLKILGLYFVVQKFQNLALKILFISDFRLQWYITKSSVFNRYTNIFCLYFNRTLICFFFFVCFFQLT